MNYSAKQKWTKNGWVKVDLSVQEKEHLSSVVAHMPYQRGEFEFAVTRRNDLTALDEIQQTIQVGNTHSEIDALPYALQHILREEDKFHMSNGKMFRIVDPITQAIDGDWGSDKSEADMDLLAERNSIGRQYLQMTYQLNPEASEVECTDMLGVLSENTNGELLNASPFLRMDVPLDRIGQMSTSGDVAELDDDGFENGYDEEDIECGHQMATPILPDVSAETMLRVNTVRAEWMPRIAMAQTEEEKEMAAIVMEQALDRVLEPELANKMDSPWLGHQYSPPRRKHEFIQLGSESHLTVAAEERVTLFHQLFNEAVSYKSNTDLYGVAKDSGMYGKVRGIYAHDKELVKDWSIDDFTDKNGVVHLSALNQTRQNFIDVWRKDGKTDEEKLRRILYVFFDREAGEVPATYENGVLTKPSRRSKDSRWRQERTEALRDLFLTKGQWNAVYAAMNLVKERIKLNTNPTEDSQKASSTLQKNFERIHNLSDLAAYRRWATKREWIRKSKTVQSHREDGKSYERTEFYQSWEFKPSFIDRISIKNETRWYAALRKKENHLKQRLRLFTHLEAAIKDIQPMDLPEMSVVCVNRTLVTNPKTGRRTEENCDSMAIGVPQFAVLQDGKGICFVECPECGKKVWLLEPHESGSDIRTKEEWHGHLAQAN